MRGMYGAEEVREIAAWADEIGAYPEVPNKYMMYFEESKLEPGKRILNRMENFYPYHRGFGSLFDSEKLRGSVAQLLDEPAVLFKDKINFKMPGGDGFKPHQDIQAGWDKYCDFHISVLICIDEATLANGCLELAPGHHKRGIVGAMWTPLDEKAMKDMKLAPCPTKPGDAVFFDSYIPHASGPNLTSTPRRVLYVTYNRQSDGDHRVQYYADKRKSYPPDCERQPGKEYVFRV